MFNLGFSELILLAIIALIFIGPKQLPELARTLGRTLNELKRATGDLKDTFTSVDLYQPDSKPDTELVEEAPKDPVNFSSGEKKDEQA